MVSELYQSPVLFGTSNLGKLTEVSSFARSLGFEVRGLRDDLFTRFGPPPSVPEVASTYEGNARLKGEAYARWASNGCITDDTGLEIACLAGLPGVYTAPWGPGRVAEMLGIRGEVSARFVCCMVYTEASGRAISVEGAVDGVLRGLTVSEAKGPLPFSKFFYPEGERRSLGALLSRGSWSFLTDIERFKRSYEY